MPTDSSGGDPTHRMFDLNRPQGYAKDDYLWQWKVAQDTVFDIIRKSNSNQNVRDIMDAVMFSISLIAHDDLRRKQEILFYTAIDYITKQKSSELSETEKAAEIKRVCAITMGNLTAYVDKFRGLAHTLKIGELVNQDKSYFRRKLAWDDAAEEDRVIDLG